MPAKYNYLKIKEGRSMAKTLGELASEYVQKEFPVYPEKDDTRNIANI